MNIRVIGIVFIVILFALTSGYMSYSMYGGTGLTDAYSNGNIKVFQKTSAGTVPHQVTIVNNGNETITVKEGQVLTSSVSQNMVIAEDKNIGPKTNLAVKAYGLEPSERSKAGTKLLPVNTTYDAVTKVISLDSNNTINTQLQIWIIMTGGNLNPYTGEPVEVVDKYNLRWSQIRQDISEAKNNVMSTFNVGESELSTLKDEKINAGQTWIENASEYIKSSLGI